MLVVICIVVFQVVTFLLFYPLLVAGKREDEELQNLCKKECEKKIQKSLEDKSELQREIFRMIEKEIYNGSAPVRLSRIEVSSDSYHLVESRVKMNQFLEYFFRGGEFSVLAGKQLRNNIYMDVSLKKVIFRSGKSKVDRKNMKVAAKRWIKTKHPSFDGDVYVENVRCFFEYLENEKWKCIVNEEKSTTLIFSRKHLNGLYLQCLMYRKEVAQHIEHMEGLSEVCNRIYRLDDVDVLFQCLLLDQMEWKDGKMYGYFNTVYLLRTKNG